MKESNANMPHPGWTEFDWERLLQKNDDAAHRYIRLLERYHDLPGADALIARSLGEDYQRLQPGPEIPAEQEGILWIPSCDEPFSGEEPEPLAPGEGGGEESQPGYPYERHPLYETLLQASVNWINIYSLLLPPEMHRPGAHALYHISRALASAIYGIGDGRQPQLQANIAFAKRCLCHINQAIGCLDEVERKFGSPAPVVQALRKRLLQACQLAQDHLHACRQRAARPGKKTP